MRTALTRRPGAGIAITTGAILAAVAIGGCRSEESVAGAAPTNALEEEPCRSVPVGGARCYRLQVPEARSKPSSAAARHIKLRIVVLPATGTGPALAPIFQLAGGPGQAATFLLDDRSIVESSMREKHDLVFADQRGTGQSNGLNCRFYGPPENAQSYFREFLPLDKVQECRASLARSTDLAEYTTAASVEDLEAIRVALGYPRIALIGGSYGTRLAMEYVRRHEDRVSAVVLEGPVTPLNHVPENFGALAERALQSLFAECVGSATCAEHYPKFREEAAVVFDRLRRGNVKAIVRHPNATAPAEVTITRDHVAEAIRYMMYSSAGAARVPSYLHEAFNGNFSPIAQFLMRFRSDGTFDGLYLSITCAEDVPFVSPGAAERDDPTYLGGYRARQQRAACAEWPRGTAPADSRLPVKSSVPTLIIAGLLDPVTPASNADVLAKTLTNTTILRVPFGGHSPYGLQGLDCLEKLKTTFLERSSTAGLDTGCVARISRSDVLGR